MLKKCLILTLASSLLFGIARAEMDVIGFVKVVEGEVIISSVRGAIPVSPGIAVHIGDTINTGDNGSLGITLKDNTVMSLGPDSEFRIDEYLYAPAQDELKLFAILTKGTLHYISGVIAKLKPKAVSVKTPSGIIGVRGTRFLVKAEAE